MHLFTAITLIIGAYLLGSISSAVFIGKIFYKQDIRDFGSGNAGATNAFRVFGVKAGIAVFIFDMAKGFFAVKLILLSNYFIPDTKDFINLELLLGISAFIGHVFPVFTGFKGGKGVATLCGVVLSLHPLSALIIIGIFGITLLLTKYVSLSSIVSGISFPVLLIFVFHITITSLIAFSIIIAILLLITHQKNIERIVQKKENKVKLSLNKKNK